MPDYPLPYELVEQRWRDFNHVYLVIYPLDRASELESILGPQFDESWQTLSSPPKKHARRSKSWPVVNCILPGSTWAATCWRWRIMLVRPRLTTRPLLVYPAIPEDERPWRVMWYQDGPYEAYYHMARYQDIINLANTTFFALGEYTGRIVLLARDGEAGPGRL